jgi:hypothetical protein
MSLAELAPEMTPETESFSPEVTRAVIKVLRDIQPMMHFGFSSGQLTARNDGFAPDKGLPMLLEPEALGLHMLIIGITGAGKSVLLKQLIQDYVRSGIGGLLCMDGKAALPGELVGLRDNLRDRPYIYIDPRYCVLALMEGLDPQTFTQALAEINVRPDTTEAPVWDNLTRLLVSASSEILWNLVRLDKVDEHGQPKAEEDRQWRWCVVDVNTVAVMIMSQTPDQIKETRKYLDLLKVHCQKEMKGLLGIAVDFAEKKVPGWAEEQRGSVSANYESWTGPLLSHPTILPWCQAETGVSPESCLYGGLVGVNLGEVQFGRAGVIASSLVKGRIYAKGKLRADHGNKWAEKMPGATPVWIVLDEYQSIATRSEAEIAKQGRSLGLWLCCATQDVEGIYATDPSEHRTDTFLANLLNLVFMQSSDKTAEWLQRRVSKVWIPQWQNNTRGIDYLGSVANALGAPVYEENHPHRKMFKSFLRRGFGKFHHVHFPSTNQQLVREDDQAENFNRHNLLIGGGWQEESLVQIATHMEQTEQRTDFVTNTGASAFVELRRAGVKRRDYVELPKPTGNIAADLLDPAFTEEQRKKQEEELQQVREEAAALNAHRAQVAAAKAEAEEAA